MNSQEIERARGLAAARKSSGNSDVRNAAKVAKEISKKPIRTGLKMMTSVNLATDWVYVLMGALALLKDLSDLVGIGSLPLIGWFVTFMVALGMFMLWLITIVLGNDGNMGVAKTVMKQGATLMVGSGSEMFLSGVNFLPIMTGTVVIMYFMVLAGRLAGKLESEKQSK